MRALVRVCVCVRARVCFCIVRTLTLAFVFTITHVNTRDFFSVYVCMCFVWDYVFCWEEDHGVAVRSFPY